MLIRFSLSNFRAFRDRQELSLIASNLKGSVGSTVHVEGFPHEILRIAAMYGANASGKSTFLQALSFLVDVVRNSQRAWKPDSPIPIQPFLLDEKTAVEPCTFALEFLLNNVRYEFGFALTSREVVSEWLYSFPNNRKQLWYERNGGPNPAIKFGKKFSGENRTIESLTRPNSLFLSAGAQNNHELLLPVFSWITNRISFEFGPRSAFQGTLASKCEKQETRDRLSKLLAAADLGIVGIELTREKMDIGDDVRDAFKNLFKTLTKSAGGPSEAPDLPSEIAHLQLRHRSAAIEGVMLPSASESAGTEAFLALLFPALEVIDAGGVLCIDELNSSLHPLLALEIVRLFADPNRNPRASQLIFNTHDVNLLDSSVLRRDEIWFTEKDQEGSGHLYSLSDFKPRINENFKRGYLQGRYGALPFLGSIDFGTQSS